MSEEKYRVVKRLEKGGMAEVFVGEVTSVQGFKKRIAIKRVLPHLVENKNFIGMFLDEARLGARLNHANIVSVLDIGSSNGNFFIVMEFVEGKNLKKVIETFRQSGKPFPIKEAIFIIIQACNGLSYAHELTDEEGQLVGIVHRDISPPNILISSRGEVKVTDFGLAKATTQLENTDPGVVKGKYGYLCPEAVNGEQVDARADIFSMGIILWEMLAGRRLFLGETDFETVKKVQQADIPSLRKFNPKVDEELEQVINKALAKNVDERFGSARELSDALADYLFTNQLKVTAYDVEKLLKNLTEQKKDGSSQSASIIDKLVADEIERFTSIQKSEGKIKHITGEFEDPASWFSEDDDVVSALSGHSEHPKKRSSAPPKASDSIPANRTSSIPPPQTEPPIELTDEDIVVDSRSSEIPPPPSEISKAAIKPIAPNKLRENLTRQAPTKSSAQKKKKINPAVFVLIALALAAVGAYFAGLLDKL